MLAKKNLLAVKMQNRKEQEEDFEEEKKEKKDIDLEEKMEQ